MAHDNRNQPPATPVAAATRPPPDSTDAQKREALRTVRLSRHVSKLRKAEDYKDPEEGAEQTVAVMVNNGDHGSFRAIGRFFPNGLTQDVSVTEEELADLKAEPQDIIRIIGAEEVASLSGKGASGSLTQEEHKVLAAFRSSGLDGDAFLAQASRTGSGSASGSNSGATPSTASGDISKRK